MLKCSQLLLSGQCIAKKDNRKNLFTVLCPISNQYRCRSTKTEKMIFFQDWKQGVKSCSWFPKKEKGVRRSDCERLPKFCRRAISTLLQFLDTLFLIAASSIFIVTTYCTNIFDRNYIALFSGGWGFLPELNLFTRMTTVSNENLPSFIL